jgi:hypothetical protein
MERKSTQITPGQDLVLISGQDPYRQQWRYRDIWLISVRLEQVPNGVVVAGLGLQSREQEPRPVTAIVWRSIPVGAVIDAAMKHYRKVTKLEPEVHPEVDREWVKAWDQLGGRKGHPDKLYARLAQLFCSLKAAGIRNPVDGVAESMGVKHATASQRLQTARGRGLLDGPELTKKAKDLLGIPADERGF